MTRSIFKLYRSLIQSLNRYFLVVRSDSHDSQLYNKNNQSLLGVYDNTSTRNLMIKI